MNDLIKYYDKFEKYVEKENKRRKQHVNKLNRKIKFGQPMWEILYIDLSLPEFIKWLRSNS